MIRRTALRVRLASRIRHLTAARRGYCSQAPPPSPPPPTPQTPPPTPPEKPPTEDDKKTPPQKNDASPSDASTAADATTKATAAGGDKNNNNNDTNNEKDKIPKGFERWYPNQDNPTLPVAVEEYQKRAANELEIKKRKDKDREQKKEKRDNSQFIFVSLGASVIAYLIYSWWSSRPHGEMVDWPKVVELVKNNQLKRVVIYDQIVAQLSVLTENGDEELLYYTTIGDSDIFEFKLESLQAECLSENPAGSEWQHAIPIIYRSHEHGLINLIWQCSLPLIVFYIFAYRFPRAQKSLQSDMFSRRANGKKHNFEKEVNVKTKFQDVAGLKETKQEIMEVVDFLKAPAKYHRLGAKIPKGVLLTGPPGVGKTLLAKATAGESGVPFFSVAGSDFMEVFVGVGPARVRQLFAAAAKESPCIVFIDEIDAIGRKRQTSGKGSHDSEQESALNSILVEMDGFDSKTGVVVLAGTNRHDILDKALLRPGRFDRQISLDKPPLADRIEIFNLHLKPLTLHPNTKRQVVSERLAALTPGFSGADIMNTCNEAALMAARENEKYVGAKSFEKAIEKIIGGLEKKGKKVTQKEKRTIAFHEAGKVVCGWHLKHVDPILKVSIIPRGGDKIGYTQHLPKDKYIQTQTEIHESMIKMLGGRCAEFIEFGEVSTGAANDMNRVTKMAQQQIVKYGFSVDKVGHVSFPEGGSNEIVLQKPYSEATGRIIDEEVERIVKSINDQAMKILTTHRDQLNLVANKLLEEEQISAEGLVELLGERPFESKELSSYLEAAAKAGKDEVNIEGEESEAESKNKSKKTSKKDAVNKKQAAPEKKVTAAEKKVSKPKASDQPKKQKAASSTKKAAKPKATKTKTVKK
eukprot:TRINITY_DN2329_c5_g1_i1.p1 TRINITY_DN2329_c5_g1~~TRINITY_DN2329_c5_g1_i1.p1  ORF type:complete len:864 (+),score=227.81 TRINITY_DN2329_c5_g1_i1:33-2624(+)